MQKQNGILTTERKLVSSKSIFTVTIFVAVLTILSIWLFGLGQHRTIFENSILSISILSFAFFLFLTIGLYKGIKLKDDIGKITDKLKTENILNQSSESSDFDSSKTIIPDFDDGEGSGILISILAWISYTIFFIFIFWLFGTILWTGILFFVAMLYWVFFRAVRLILKKSKICRGNLISSCKYAAGHTLLYNFWIYGLIITTHYLLK